MQTQNADYFISGMKPTDIDSIPIFDVLFDFGTVDFFLSFGPPVSFLSLKHGGGVPEQSMIQGL